jgi:hypothetical protein
MSKSELPKLITRKSVPKDSLPASIVNEESELIDKRLSAATLADGFFDPKYLSSLRVIVIPEGKYLYSIEMSTLRPSLIEPGSRVDVIAYMNIKNKLVGFPLLVDMQVLNIDTFIRYKIDGAFANTSKPRSCRWPRGLLVTSKSGCETP